MSATASQPRGRLPRIATAAVEQARLRLVPRRNRRAARMPFVTLISLILLAGVIGLLLFNTSMQQASFAESALQDQATNLSAREQTLQMQLDDLRDPQHVAMLARRQGLVPACGAATLDLATGKVQGKAVPADGSCAFALTDPPPGRPADFDPAPVRAKPAKPAAPTTQARANRRDGNGASARDGRAARDRNGARQGQQGRQDR